MEIAIGIIGLILAIALALVPYLKKKYGDRPRLELEINHNGGSSSPRGLSPKNDISKGYIDRDDAIQVFELTWKMKLKIRNNSDIAAYYAKMYYTKDSPRFTELDKFPTKPILNSDDITLTGNYRTFEECKGCQRTKIGGTPKTFVDLKIILQYQNSHGTTFYSLYDHGQSENKNRHPKSRPKELSE